MKVQLITKVISDLSDPCIGIRNGIEMDDLKQELRDSIDVAIHYAQMDGVSKSDIKSIEITIKRSI